MAERATDLGLFKPSPWNVDLAHLDPRFAELWTDPDLKLVGFPGGGWPRRNLVDREPFTALNGPDLSAESVHGPAALIVGDANNEQIRWTGQPLVGHRAGTALYWYDLASNFTWGQSGPKVDLAGANLGGFIQSAADGGWSVESDLATTGYYATLLSIGTPADHSSQIFMTSRDGADIFASRNGRVLASRSDFPDEDFDTWGFNPGRETPLDSANFTFDGHFFAHLLWTRSLTEAEHELVGSDPFGFIRYQPRRAMVVVETAPAPAAAGEVRWTIPVDDA